MTDSDKAENLKIDMTLTMTLSMTSEVKRGQTQFLKSQYQFL